MGDKDFEPTWWRRVRSKPIVASALFVATALVATGAWFQSAQSIYVSISSTLSKSKDVETSRRLKNSYFLGRSVGGLQFEARVSDQDLKYIKLEKAQIIRYLDNMKIKMDTDLLSVDGGFLWFSGPPTDYINLIQQEVGEDGKKLFLVGYAVGHAGRRSQGFLRNAFENEKEGRPWSSALYTNAALSLLSDVKPYFQYTKDLNLPVFSEPKLKITNDDDASADKLQDSTQDLNHTLKNIADFDEKIENALNKQ